MYLSKISFLSLIFIIINKYSLYMYYILNESNFKTNKSTHVLRAQYEFILISVTDASCVAYA
jgi:hypothetical protein